MPDPDAVARDMERIFGLAAPIAAPRAADRTRRGGVGVRFAGAVALVGLGIATLAIWRPAEAPVARIEPPAVPIDRIAPPVVREETVVPAQAATALPSPSPLPIATPVRQSARRAASPPPPPRPLPSPSPVAAEAPRLTGEALRRALAEDVLITRRLNREALAKDRSNPPPTDPSQ